jgi:hypothetical protein
MLTLPTEIMVLMQPFAPVFSERTWDWVPVLVVGAILAPGKRTVTGVLRVMGLSEERQFQRYHRVLNRAKWSSLRVATFCWGCWLRPWCRPAGRSSWLPTRPWNDVKGTRSRPRVCFGMRPARAKNTK